MGKIRKMTGAVPFYQMVTQLRDGKSKRRRKISYETEDVENCVPPDDCDDSCDIDHCDVEYLDEALCHPAPLGIISESLPIKPSVQPTVIDTVFRPENDINNLENTGTTSGVFPKPDADLSMEEEVVDCSKCLVSQGERQQDLRTIQQYKKMNMELKRKLEELGNDRLNDTLRKTVGTDQYTLLTTGAKRVPKWSNESIIEGLQTKFICGSTAYEVERKKRRLPSSRTLREKMQKLHFESGCLFEVYEFMKPKVKAMPDIDRDCVIVFDEMSIQPGSHYCSNLKKFVGDITLPNHSGVATHVLVFMLVGVRTRWKQIVGYFYTGDTIDHGCLKKILFELIEKSESIGVRVHASISDCGDGNIEPSPAVERKHSGNKQQQQSKHRHRRDNRAGDSREGGGGPSLAGDDGELENFIALAPDEADIYNFSNNLINAVDNVGDGEGARTENANEANPFNEFLNPRQQQQQQQREIDDGKQQLEDPWGLGLDEQLMPPPEEEQQQEEEADNEVEKSKYLLSASNLKPLNRSQQPSPLVASSIDFLNSIDGGYLLSNGIIDEKGRTLMDDNSPSTLKPEGGAGGGEDEQVSDDDIFEQMQKKAKSYRLKLYKKHKNFKHSHHHRGGYYHPLYQHHHHQYYRQKMLERERDRWKQIHEQQLKADYQGQIRYFDSSNKLETKDDIKAHLDGTSREQWPYLKKVVNSLNNEQQQDNVPPYIKKYNRRNKQLIDLLEGTIAPLSDYSQRHHERKYHRRKNPHWMEEDLFEEQRPGQNNLGMQRNYIQETIQSSTVHSNSLPGEGIHIIYEKKHNNNNNDDDDRDYGHPTTSADPNHPYKLSSRAGQFVYHRVASPQPVGGGYGRLKRQRLPFVAITDRRLGTPPKRRPLSSSSGGSVSSAVGSSGSRSLLNHQPMP